MVRRTVQVGLCQMSIYEFKTAQEGQDFPETFFTTSFTESATFWTTSLTSPTAWSVLPSSRSLSLPIKTPAASLIRPFILSVLHSSIQLPFQVNLLIRQLPTAFGYLRSIRIDRANKVCNADLFAKILCLNLDHVGFSI